MTVIQKNQAHLAIPSSLKVTSRSHGYMSLYGGQTAEEIYKRKNLDKSQRIVDHMMSEELTANLFVATQTGAKLRRENISSSTTIKQTHFEVGKKVRQMIAEIGNTMPEDLPVTDHISKKKSLDSISRTNTEAQA